MTSYQKLKQRISELESENEKLKKRFKNPCFGRGIFKCRNNKNSY